MPVCVLGQTVIGYNQVKLYSVGEWMRKQIANIITISRILSCIYLLFWPAFSVCFYSMYIFCGITDMADGMIARKTKSVSELGAKLDTVADTVFAAVCFAKILPFMQFSTWLWAWISMIALIKIGNIIRGWIVNKKLVSIHSILNKVTGFVLFLYPLSFGFIAPVYSSAIVCFIATLSALDEGYHIRRGKEVF